jgi:polyhydroxyalkanoate synthesis regulator phasin
MAKRSIQGYVELASGLGELTRAKAVEAAQELVALGSSGSSRAKVAQQASQLAEDLLHAAEENRRQIVALVQREVEVALGKVDLARLLAEVQALGGAVSTLTAQVDDLARSVTGRGVTDVAVGASVVAGRSPVATPRPSEATSVPATSAGAARPAKKSPAKKTAAKKTAAKKTAAKKSTPESSTGSTS